MHRSLSAAYQQVLRDVLYYPTYECSPRDQKVREILGYKFSVSSPSDSKPIVTACEERNKAIASYTEAEFKLFESQTRDVNEYAKAATFWKGLANPDGTVNSAYGYLIFGRKCSGNPMETDRTHTPAEFCMRTPWEWARLALLTDRDTRQSILSFSTPDFQWQGNKDVPCTLFGHFFIRDNRLHFYVDMRSNDVILGLVYDCVWFTYLQHRMLRELKVAYSSLQLGDYTHYAHSMHIYERNFPVARRMIGRIADEYYCRPA